MLNGTKYHIFLYAGYALLTAAFAFIFYIQALLAESVGKVNPGGLPSIPPIALDFTKYFYVYFAVSAIFIPLIAVASMFAKRAYREAVGKVFEITKTRSTFRGVSRFQGMRISIQVPDQITVGDRVKITGYDVQRAGRARVLILMGKKLAPGDPDCESVYQPGSLTEQTL